MAIVTGKELVAGAIEIMAADLSRHLEIRGIAQELHYSQFHFQRTFRRCTGIAPGQYQSALRIQHAKVLLAGTTLPVGQVAVDVGYQSKGTFIRQFARQVGLTPGRFRAFVDQVAGRRLCEVVTGPAGPQEVLAARLIVPGDHRGEERVTLLGAFDSPIPSGVPASFSLTTTDRATFPARAGLPVLTASYPGEAELTDMLLGGPGVLVGRGLRTTGPGEEPGSPVVVLRPPSPRDPPILTAVPVLYLVGRYRVS